MRIVPARASDEQAIKRLLTLEQLPIADIAAASLNNFLVLRERDELAGTVGLDLAGDVALLRSLVVPEAMRGRGVGRKLVMAAEALAKERGVRALYLLTTTAETFFAALGYETVARGSAPPAVKAMPQYRTLCPASSILMVRKR